MTGEIPYIFRQNTDFFYYTGCLEPNSLLVIWTNEANHVRSALFMRPKDQHAELWNGPRTGVQNAVTHFGVDEAYDIKEFPAFFQKYEIAFAFTFLGNIILKHTPQFMFIFWIISEISKEKDTLKFGMINNHLRFHMSLLPLPVNKCKRNILVRVPLICIANV